MAERLLRTPCREASALFGCASVTWRASRSGSRWYSAGPIPPSGQTWLLLPFGQLAAPGSRAPSRPA